MDVSYLVSKCPHCEHINEETCSYSFVFGLYRSVFKSINPTISFLPICHLHPKRSVSRIFHYFSFGGFQLCILGYFACLTCYLSVLSVLESLIPLFGITGACTPKGRYTHPKRTVNFGFIFLQPFFRLGKVT